MKQNDKNSILIVYSKDYQPVTTFSHQFKLSLLLVLMQFARHRKPGSSRHDHEEEIVKINTATPITVIADGCIDEE